MRIGPQICQSVGRLFLQCGFGERTPDSGGAGNSPARAHFLYHPSPARHCAARRSIIVIGGGRVVESGTHEELQAMEDGVYRRLAALQFRG